jgi:daunorubicin/doxorubicin transport system permease protein
MSTTRSPLARADALQAVLGGGPRPTPPGPLSAALTFGWRAVLKVKHVPEQVADVIGIPVIFTLMFTYLFGGALAGSTHSYLQFLLPGTLAMAAVLLTVYTGVNLSTDIASGAFDRFRTLPIWRPAPILGGLIGDAGRYAIGSGLVVALGLAMGFRPHGGAVGVLAGIALVVVFAFCLSWVWTAVALILRTPASVQVAGLMLLFPLTFASNAFVDPSTTPSWVRTLVAANPISHLVTAERGLMQGSASAAQVVWVLAAAAALVAVFAPLTAHLYRRDR